ncbi:MAG TPA: dihydrolipoyl dehydrogenase, partial [Planctomycetota bacterium]|nr:dihydrolipoyl dehydrogenase [Planctomycetota bacterium]
MPRFDLVVIGAGPGGYPAAIRAAQLGWRVAVVEKEDRLGGTCLRIGCIPSKALLESSELYESTRERLAEHGVRVGSVEVDLDAMHRRKSETVAGLARGVEGLLRKNRVERVRGHGSIAEPGRVMVRDGDKETPLETDRILIATGSKPGTIRGIEIDGELAGTSTEALAWPTVPERLVVIGAGAIGLELGSVWRRLGSKVVVLEFLDRILAGMDAEIATQALGLLRAQGLDIRLSKRVTAVRKLPNGKGGEVETDDGEVFGADRVLVAVGRVPNTEGLGLEKIGVELEPRGQIRVDDAFETSVPGIFAIGDVIRGPMLAHKAEEEGIACVERMITGYGHVSYDAIPNVVYTQPEVASVGKTEEDLEGAGIPYRKGTFP